MLPGVIIGHQHPRKPLNDSFLFYCQAKKQTEHLMEKFPKLLITTSKHHYIFIDI